MTNTAELFLQRYEFYKETYINSDSITQLGNISATMEANPLLLSYLFKVVVKAVGFSSQVNSKVS